MKKVLTVISARPQFVKAFTVSEALKRKGINEVIVHTGQHYDYQMSEVFFDQLGMKKPDYNLEIGSGSHHYQISEAIKKLEKIMIDENPDVVLLYGDTNGTLSGAISAGALKIPIAHVEAGIRIFDKHMPEERNRVITDYLSEWLFVPTPTGVTLLEKEGLTKNVFMVGDVMLDSILLCQQKAENTFPNFLNSYDLKKNKYLLLTMHRAETTDSPEQIKKILSTLDSEAPFPILFPVHPRTKPIISKLEKFKNIQFTQPLSYFEMLLAEMNSYAIVTDSGGVQKEAAIFGVPCITLLQRSGWVETVEQGFNTVTGLSIEKLSAALRDLKPVTGNLKEFYGNGQASERIATILYQHLN